jgi:hypothetical protein
MKRVAALLFLVTTMAFSQQKATQYGQVVFPDGSVVQGRVIILFGSPNEQGFLKGLAIAAKKATFICDNIDTQAATSHSTKLDDRGNYTFDVTSATWPVNETIAVCGTVILKQRYRNDSVDTDFKFGAWGSAMAYADLTAQISPLRQYYVNFCPQNAANCDGSQVHPEPDLPQYTATVTGHVEAHDCNSSAAITSGTVEVVFDATQEGRDFNHSTSADAVCDSLPGDFKDAETFNVGELDVNGHGTANYTLQVTFTGKGVSGTVYVCALTRARKGTTDSCDDHAESGTAATKRHEIFNPNMTLRVDLATDYTQQ